MFLWFGIIFFAFCVCLLYVNYRARKANREQKIRRIERRLEKKKRISQDEADRKDL